MVNVAQKVPYSYLDQQLAPDGEVGKAILTEWRQELERGWFTLGPAVERLERRWAEVCNMKHAIGVNSGTDALIIALKILGVGPEDEVITVPNSFVSTVGAIVAVGARPIFCDVGDDYLIDMTQVSGLLTDKTKAIIPVDLTGRPAVHGWRDAGLYGTWILRDACQSIGATYNGQSSAKLSHIAAYSLHPLKNVHACGDGGMIVTDNDDWAEWMRLYRNHGLVDRDHVTVAGINSRLDTLQAIAAWHLLEQLDYITARRNANARQYRQGLEALAPDVLLPPLDPPGSSVRQAYHTFVVQVSYRRQLMAFLANRGIETKIHYPIPIHLQKGYEFLGYRRGSLPKAEEQADRILSLPVHEYLSEDQIQYVISSIRAFYAERAAD